MRRARHADGSESVTVRDNPERIAQLYADIATERRRLFDGARRAGRRERSEALDADALFATLARRGGGGRGAGTKVLVRVDLDALLRGYPLDGEVCEIAGSGPVAPSAVADMLASSNAFLAGIVTRGEQVVGVAHLGRTPRAVQQSALEWLYPTCAREGCTATRLERDHRVDWAHTRVTLLEWLDRLCPHDHDLKTMHGWALVEGTGKRPMVPPDDPRHPKNRPKSA